MNLEAPTARPLLLRPHWVTTVTVVAVLGVLLIAYWPVPRSDIRVHNASGVTLHDVIVDGVHYGDIPAGESTPYQSWGPAYPYPRIDLVAGGARLGLIPNDHVHDNLLGAGRFTYVVTVGPPDSPSDISVDFTKD